MFKKLIWMILCWIVAAPAFATQVLILHTDFVANAKFEKLMPLAAAQQVQLKHLDVSQNKETLANAIQAAEIVVLDVPRPLDRQQAEQASLALLNKLNKPYMIIGGGAPKFNEISMLFGFKLLDLYANGGKVNFSHYFEALHTWKSKGKKRTFKTEKLPEIAIYHGQSLQYFSNITDYQHWYVQYQHKQPQAHVVYLLHPSSVTNLTTEKIDALIQLNEQKGVMPVVLLWNESKTKIKLSDFLQNFPATALVNMTHIQQGQNLVAELQKINVPVIQSLSFQGNASQWQSSVSGIPPHLAAVFLSLPETWGFSDPLVLSRSEAGQEQWMKPQVDLLLDKVIAQEKLKSMPNQDKKIALMFWNYPQGQNNLSASNLNIPLSIENINQALKKTGYQTEHLNEQKIIQDAQQLLAPYYQHEKLQPLLDKGLVAYFPVKKYQQWVQQLPEHRKNELSDSAKMDQLSKHWAVVNKEGEYYFAIPLIQYQHVLILPQPPRSAKVGQNYHDKDSIPDPLYLATYLYLQEQANALIHLGTHGTQEWLPGKDRGLDAADYSFLTAGNLPIFYPYVQDNIAEATQAKRRGRAVVISHQTAPLAPSGLYDELRDLHDLIHQYVQIDEGTVKQQTEDKIIQLVVSSGMAKDLQVSESQIRQDFPKFYDQLHDHLHALAQQAVPLGLHKFGQSAPDEQRLLIVMQQLGPNYLKALKLDPDEVYNGDAKFIKDSFAYRFLAHHLLNQPDQQSENFTVSAALRKHLQTAKKNFEQLNATQEIDSLISALSNGFVLSGSGGDPIRQPDSISGRNLYAFEANKVPSQSAYEIGQKTFSQLIEQYQKKNPNQYPNKVAFSLWSSETIRHLGVTEGQVLAALGLQPVWDDAGKVQRLDIIPHEQLKRPRIDTVIQATSVYRDQFDSFIRLLAEAMQRLSVLDEPNNQLYVHAQQMQKALIAQNIAPEKAKELSYLKIFSNEPGEFGSGLTKQTLSYDHWENDTALANTFLNNLQYAYGDKTWGEKSPVNLFAENLKGVDIAVMSRSSNIHGVLSTDHPFEYLGGLSLAIRSVQGTAPELLITDLRQNKTEVTSLKNYLSDELRTRYLNPEWIKKMKDEGYAGTLEVLNATNNLYGWNVTDPSVVRADQWQDLYETYVQDKRNLGVNEWFKHNNPSAQLQVLNRMAEAIRKEYWQADDVTKRQIAERIQSLEQQVNLPPESKQITAFTQQILSQKLTPQIADKQLESSENAVAASTQGERPKPLNAQQVQEDVKQDRAVVSAEHIQSENHQQTAKGQGLTPGQSTPPRAQQQDFPQQAAQAQNPANMQMVKGQALERMNKKQELPNYVWFGAFILAFLMGVGIFKQVIQHRQN